MIYKKYISGGLLYLAGALLWIIFLFALKSFCIVDVLFLTDGMWTKNINNHLVSNLTNSIAFRTQNMGCDDKFIYTARYYPNGVGSDYTTRSLTSIIDVATWKELESDNISTTYVDIRHKYILYTTSDGIYMRIFDK